MLSIQWGYTLWQWVAHVRSVWKRKNECAPHSIVHSIPDNTMNTDIHSKLPINQLPEVVREAAKRAAAAAEDATAAVEGFAKDTCQTLSSKVEEGVEHTKEYAQHAAGDTLDTANHATGVAKDMYQSATTKATCWRLPRSMCGRTR